jgi:glyoxylase I family protein
MTQTLAIPYDAGIVRYQVSNVERSVAFYVEQLGFKLLLRGGAAFASVSRGNLTLLLSGPGSSGARRLPDGRSQEPGGFNRIVLRVSDLAAEIEALKRTAVTFRNEVELGPGGKQIQVEDPDGNPIELFQPE